MARSNAATPVGARSRAMLFGAGMTSHSAVESRDSGFGIRKSRSKSIARERAPTWGSWSGAGALSSTMDPVCSTLAAPHGSQMTRSNAATPVGARSRAMLFGAGIRDSGFAKAEAGASPASGLLHGGVGVGRELCHQSWIPCARPSLRRMACKWLEHVQAGVVRVAEWPVAGKPRAMPALRVFGGRGVSGWCGVEVAAGVAGACFG